MKCSAVEIDFCRRYLAPAVALLVVPVSAFAIQGDYTVGIEAEYSDNIGLSETNAESDTALSIFGGFLVEHESANLDADVRSLLEFKNYTNNTFSNETLGSLRANLNWKPYPGRFHWRLEDYFTQTRRIASAPFTPNNRADTNAFSTGPDLFVRIDNASRLQFQGRYSDYYFEDSIADSQRAMGSVAWIRAIRPELDLSANLVYEDADFTEAATPDFKRTDAFLRGSGRHGRSRLTVDVGGSSLERDNADDVDGFLARLTYLRQISSSVRLEIDAATQYTDSGVDLLTLGTSDLEIDRDNEQISGDVFYDQRIEARYTSGTSDRNWSLYGILREEDYEVLPQDRETQGLRLDIHRDLLSAWALNAHAGYTREKFTDINRTNRDSSLGLGVEYRLARRVTTRLDYYFNTRDSNLVGGDYDENRLVFLLYYGGNPTSFR